MSNFISQEYTIWSPPKPIGYWVLYPNAVGGQFKFAVNHKPTDEQIKNTTALLGWGWEDAEE